MESTTAFSNLAGGPGGQIIDVGAAASYSTTIHDFSLADHPLL